MKSLVVPLIVLALLAAAPAGNTPLYSNDVSKLAQGKLPEDQFLALAGEFTVKDVDGNRLIELGATPLESFGLLFGPPTETATGTVSARVWTATTGKRVPEFGIGSNDAGGYKLWLIPRLKQLVIRKADQTVATVKYDTWKPGTWTKFRLQVSKTSEDAWVIRGKVWADGTEEPKDWLITFDEKEEPAAGRASVWANPYSGQPVRFDDLELSR